jgi:serine protease Do
MTKGQRIRIALYCLLAGVAGVLVGSKAWTAYFQAPTAVAAAPDSAPVTQAGIQTTFAPIVEKDLPAVVNISSSKVVRISNAEQPFFMDPFFRQFFGENPGRQFGNGPSQRREHGLGSGVIIKSDGYILTNNHVIDGATDITVTLLDKRNFKAKVVGADAKTDIGVLKIDASGLPAIGLGDSSKVRVGDIVLAMGQPFGLAHTVTMGIVSAKGRTTRDIPDLNPNGYEDFIQTDAAINPGNSGGALVDVRGELIGVNTAILSGGGGGNQGIGFAVPVNMAHAVMDQLISHGKVSRGYMGVQIQDITAPMAKSFRTTDTRGAIVADVTPNAPAAAAGLQRGDIIREIDGQPVEDSSQLRLRLSMTPPGTTVRLSVLRDGVAKTINVKLGEFPDDQARASVGGSDSGSNALDGVEVQDLDSQTLRQLGLQDSTKGVVITNVADGSAAAEAGLRPGDVIQEVDHTAVANSSDFNRAIRRSSGHTVLLLLNRGGGTQYVAVEPR